MDLTLDTPIRYIPRVGPSMGEKLEVLGIETVRDFLYHIPFRYDDFSLVSKIAQIKPGETVTIQAEVKTFSAFLTKNGKKLQEAKVTDETGKLSVIWFNQPFLRSVILPGSTIRLSGPVSWFNHKLVLNAPQYEIVNDIGTDSLHTGRLVPIYPETAGLSSKWMRGRIHFLLETLQPILEDPLPDYIRKHYQLPNLYDALFHIHFPEKIFQADAAKKRLAFDELLILQLLAYAQKKERLETTNAISCTISKHKLDKIIQSLPFTLTADQITAIGEISADMAKTTPMNRLLEGDVGSGKTIVAAISMFSAFQNNLQSVLLAPTQILAEQHYKSLTAVLGTSGVDIRLMTGNTKDRTPATITIGTHAVLADDVHFKKLGLVIIDEQHRFGVKQRSKLTDIAEKSDNVPHLLTMTATPIPRTLAKTVFGTLDISRLKTMPSGRKRVKTWVVGSQKRSKAYEWIRSQISELRTQAFVVCPLIEDSENFSEVKAVKTEFENLKTIFSTLKLGLIHGKLTATEKTTILQRFRDHEFDILVATPVVEVGIDIPNATIIVIEGSERFGLGQLHQLRGRVGRSEKESYCLLFTTTSESESITRLKAMETMYDGAELAEVDMKLRGPGDILGSRQHGAGSMKIASYMDVSSVNNTYEAVKLITEKDPDLANLPLLRELVKKSKIETIQQD